jgi:16S rRNA (guanine527-N7)-methyltransferase
MNLRGRLLEGAQALGVALQPAVADALLRLLDELLKWNQAYNLTAVTAPEEMLTHHLLDSLAVAPYLHGARVADVGTGAGFPGLPLALVRPDARFTLIDSNGKKQRFVAHAARTLGLTNVEAVHARVEAMRPDQPFETVVARAFAPLPKLLELVAPLCGPGSRVLAMKGRNVDAELAGLPPDWQVERNLSLLVPGLQEERHLLLVTRKAASGV